jgi:hypothetical protein
VTGRRRFLGGLAAAPLVPAALAEAGTLPSPAPSIPGTQSDLLVLLARERYGAHLSEAEIEQLRKVLAETLESTRALRKVPLANSDEPVTAFAALRPAE